jgi:PAS domain S-box-containing protein
MPKIEINYSKFKTKPGYIFAVLILTILIAEIIVMYLLPLLVPKGTSEFIENMCDGALLALFVSPVLWKMVVVPMRGEVFRIQRRSQNIINSNSSGIFSINENGMIKSFNPAFQNILNLQITEIQNHKYKDIIPELKGMELEEMSKNEFITIKNNGNEKHISIKYLKIPDDEITHTLIIDDVTEKVNIQWELALQKMNSAASARLASLGEMAGGVAHEINTPLAALKLLQGQVLEELTEKNVDLARIEKMTNKMEKTTDRISKIIQGMRNITRDGSKDPMAVESLKSIIEDVVSLSWEKFSQSNSELNINNIDETILVKCRAVEIAQVLLNFLNNSIDAISDLENKWVELKVTKNENNVEIYITDSGAGIPSDIAEKIFNPFFTTKDVGKGTGLGLSISLGIIRAHGGNVKLNKDCPNTQFVISLPSAVV